MSFKKVKTIAKAILSEKPVDEKWYQDRIKTCEGCEYNSDNIAEDDKTILQKLRLNVNSSRYCTACLCFIDDKCAVKTEVCGRVALNPPRTPLWDAIEIESSHNDGVKIENLTPNTTKLSASGNEYLFDFGVTTEATIVCEFKVTRSKGLKILSVEPACGCTVPTVSSLSSKSSKLGIKISTIAFKEGVNEKTLKIRYQDVNNIKDIYVRFRNIINQK